MRQIDIRAGGAALLAGFLGLAASAEAATVTTNFAVSLTVTSECAVLATPMAFGTTGVVGGARTATSTITVTCTALTPFSIALNEGAAPGATIAARLLRPAAGTSTVTYSIYQDVARTLLWGNTPATIVNAGPATGLPQAFTAYGLIPAGQGSAAPGAYLDTITVTVTY